jgi:hypothetical protein
LRPSWRLRGLAGTAALLAGAVFLAVGALLHFRPVLVQLSTEGPGELLVPYPPDVLLPSLARTVEVLQSESRLIREVTVGGVARLPDGRIKRTYTGSAPSQCPT